MKHWNKDDLILFYYGELDHAENKEIRKALSESTSIQQEYADLCDFLDNQTSLEVVPPEENLNQRIMASVYQQAEKQNKSSIQQRPQKFNLFGWIKTGFWHQLAGATFAMSFVVISIFFLGRWSTQLESSNEVAEASSEVGEPNDNQGYFNKSESQRVLISNVSSHIEISGRLLTMVSNGNGDLSQQIDSRRQIIEELVVLNRMYRRIVEQSGDQQLATLLQHMESILIELNHTQINAEHSDLQNIKQRIEQSDLIYQLKVTNKKLDQKLI